MPTTTSRLVVSSTDLLSSTLSIDATATLTQAGTSTAIPNTSGLGVTNNGSSTSIYTLYPEASYGNGGAHKIYLRNASATAAENLLITVGSQVIGALFAGDAALIPWNRDTDFKITPSHANINLEHAIFYE